MLALRKNLLVADVLGKWYRLFGEGVLDLLFPPSCLACAAAIEETTEGMHLCRTCFGQLPIVEGAVCRRCAERVPDLPGDVDDCGHCREERLRFDRALAWGQYEGLLGELLVKMKHDRSERLARMFGHKLWETYGSDLQEADFNAVFAVPMHPWRRIRRGTNPPAVMAKIMGQELGVPVMRGVLCRRKSLPQKGLSRKARFRNMNNEMWTKAGYHLEAFRVLLIDDILTTGATCSEAARALKRAGAAEVTVLVVGRTPTSV